MGHVLSTFILLDIYMCVYGACGGGGGGNIWFVNTTAADGESQRQKDASICTCVHIILSNGGLHEGCVHHSSFCSSIRTGRSTFTRQVADSLNLE